MKKVFKHSRALMIILALMLAFTPMSALANTGETKTVNYVALGDSLAAGVYFDKSVGTGYADHIKSDLESIGYEVNLDNQENQVPILGRTSQINEQ